MKTDRKLKRGLADLSNLFSQDHESLPKKREVAAVNIGPPQNGSSKNRLLRLVCTTFFQSPEIFQITDFLGLMDAFKPVFQESYFLSVAPTQNRYEAFARSLSLPSWENIKDDPAIHLYSVGHRLAFGHVPGDQFREIVQPRIASAGVYDFSDSKRALAVFDSTFLNGPVPSTLELMDHCVFIVSPDSDQLVRAYDQMKYCLGKNQLMRCSILLAGRRAGALWEFVYERFSEIVSQFLGCDLGFLGWIENGDMRLNPELLLEEGGSFVRLPSKVHLSETLSRLVLSE